MSWGKIKKINSDMTMPLNELFWENKTLVASDTILQAKTGSISTTRSITFKPKFNGSLRVFATARAEYTNNYFRIKNLDTTERIYERELPYQTDADYNVDISVEKGVTYQVSCNYAKSVKIGGSIIDVNPLEVIQ